MEQGSARVLQARPRRALDFAVGLGALLFAASAGAGPGPLPEPQLVMGLDALVIGYEADPAALQELLPAGMQRHPANMVVMNMYRVADGSRTSGLGAYNLIFRWR